MSVIELFPELPSARDMHRAAEELATGTHGSFARRIGEAYLFADSENRARLTQAFPELFEKGMSWGGDRA
jgi:hypothetical protein